MPLLEPNRAQKLIDVNLANADATVVGDPVSVPYGARSIALQSAFLRAAGGSECDVYLQTSLDGEEKWTDIINHHFTTTSANKVGAVKTAIAVGTSVTPTDGSMTDDNILDGLIGDRVRVKVIYSGTYSGASSVRADVVMN